MKRSTITLVVLSEETIEGRDIGYILESCDTGDCVLASTGFEDEDLSGKQMADALKDAGSDPGFFMLDDAGNHTED
jgi:hypothetical protein